MSDISEKLWNAWDLAMQRDFVSRAMFQKLRYPPLRQEVMREPVVVDAHGERQVPNFTPLNIPDPSPEPLDLWCCGARMQAADNRHYQCQRCQRIGTLYSLLTRPMPRPEKSKWKPTVPHPLLDLDKALGRQEEP